MKRNIVALILAFFSIVSLLGIGSACADKDKCENISQIRYDIFSAETDEFLITAYAENREIPLTPDGKAGERSNVIILKICTLSAINGTYSASITIEGKEYSALLEQRAENILKAEIPVETLPKESFTIKITGEKSAEATLKSILPEGVADYTVPLDTVKKELKITIASDAEGEFLVRVICENGEAYWYVGFVTEEKTYSFLLDASGKEIMARKTDDNTINRK